MYTCMQVYMIKKNGFLRMFELDYLLNHSTWEAHIFTGESYNHDEQTHKISEFI